MQDKFSLFKKPSPTTKAVRHGFSLRSHRPSFVNVMRVGAAFESMEQSGPVKLVSHMHVELTH